MNVVGLRARYHVDPETGAPLAVNLKTNPEGEIKLFLLEDRTRQGLPAASREAFKVHWEKVPQRMTTKFFVIAKPDGEGALTFDPRKDTWTAPEWIEWLDLIVSFGEPNEEGEPTPGKLFPIRPRPTDWKPE